MCGDFEDVDGYDQWLERNQTAFRRWFPEFGEEQTIPTVAMDMFRRRLRYWLPIDGVWTPTDQETFNRFVRRRGSLRALALLQQELEDLFNGLELYLLSHGMFATRRRAVRFDMFDLDRGVVHHSATRSFRTTYVHGWNI